MKCAEILTERRTKLYGPQREVTRQHCKSKCTKDSVRTALQKGEYVGDSDVWLTSAKESYQGEPKSDVVKPIQSKQSRDTTNFVLGFDKVTYLTTTEDYKSHEVKDKPKKSQVYDMDKSHIPDFCPEYVECRKTKPSEYQVSFTLDPSQPVSTLKTSEDRKKHTNDLRSTHFQLGSCSDSKTSETSHSFCEMTKKEQSKMLYASERCKSTVFRPGDWNNNDQKMIKQSVTQSDFCRCEEIKPRAEAHARYHRATHFKLGSEQNKEDSIYTKDFTTSPNLATCKPSLANAPVPAMVIPTDTDTSFESTLQSNFGNCDRDIMLQLKEERKTNCTENKCRQTKNSVPISFKKEASSVIPQHLMSTSTCHFHQPLEKEENKPYTGVPEYNHLTSDYNGTETKQSETKASYLELPIACKELREECHRQFKENKATHFDFGIDNLNDTVTEQCSQYRQHLPLDPSLQPAGKSLPEKKLYRHIDGIGGQYTPAQITKQSDSNIEIQSTSVMKRDYKPVSSQRVTENIPVKTVDTHFFHMDNDFQGTQNSTTKTDFLPPEMF